MTHTKKIILCALFAAMACVATMVIQVPSPMSGYVNMGDAVVLLGAFMLGPVMGMAAGGVGSALADLFLGYTIYAPGTLIIKGLMALTAGLIYRAAGKRVGGVLLAGLCGEVIMVAGYFGYAALIMGRGLAAAASVPGNLVQGVFGLAASSLLCLVLRKNAAIDRALPGFSVK